ncbi:2693_t:CDS:2, partial [Entrophospora sp. SA101]
GKEGVIAYASKTIVGAQERYSVTELELLAVKWAVGQFHISSKQLALRKIHEFMLKNNQLYWRKEGIERKVVQQHEMEEILFNLHGIRSCDTCQQLRNRKKIEQLHPIEVGKVFDCVGIDIVGPLPITSTTEYLTKWPEARAIKDIQANTVAQFIYEDIICRHGTPKVLLSDRGTSFVNSVVRALCETMKTAHILTERFNKTLCETLAKYVIQNGNFEWDQFVPSALFAYQTKIQKSTKLSPFFLLYGRNEETPLTRKSNPEEDDFEWDLEEHIKLITKWLYHMHMIAKQNINKAQTDQKDRYDKKIKLYNSR